MPLYEYKCPQCSSPVTRTQRGEVRLVCVMCGFHGEFKRVYAVNFAPVMQEHYNVTVGQPISDMRQFKNELRRKSDEATEHTGIEHDFQPVDLSDRKSIGVTLDDE